MYNHRASQLRRTQLIIKIGVFTMFSENIKKIRKDLKISQSEFAYKIGLGWTQATVSNIERGRFTYKDVNRIYNRISEVFGIDTSAYMEETDDSKSV